MSWCGRTDRDACCDGPHGPVDGHENVARLLHEAIIDPDRAAFTRRDLAAHKIAEPSNVCGDADGCSVDRMIQLNEDDVAARSKAYAAEKPGRVAAGAVIASVADLRGIRHPSIQGQAVFVYDDPRAANDLHAVVRLSDEVPRSDFKLMQRKVIDAFRRKVA